MSIAGTEGESEEGSRLELDGEQMRAAGYRTVDALIDWLGDGSAPPMRRSAPQEVAARLAGQPTAEGEPYDVVLDRLFRDVLPYASRTAHPAYFAFVPAAGTWPGALGDFIASACNVYAGSWMEAAGPSQLELEVLSWFKDWVGYPAEAAGSLVTGGSAANLTALACARESLIGAMRDDLVIYVSDQAHSSLARAARTLGFRPDQVRVLPVGNDLRLKPATLEAAIAADEAAGRKPFLVVANAGTTSSGAIDPVAEISALCRARPLAPRRRGLWRLRDPDRARPLGTRRDRARRLDHARPAQVALPAVRVRLPARPRRERAPARVRDQLRLPAGR